MIHKKDYARAGFTLTEIIAVFAVIGLLAAVAVPTMLHFVDRGKQINRANIARTLYLAAQNQLTELRITKNLKTELTYDYCDPVTGEYLSEAALLEHQNDDGAYTNVYQSLGNYLPGAELANKNEPYVHFISKEKGVPGSDDAVAKLLGPVMMDKSILNDAILIEYNIRTGVVLSVFYSDAVTGAFVYDADNPDNDVSSNLFGTRGMGEGGYAYADSRKQGYYGVEDTNKLDESLSTLIKVYDSYNPPPDSGLVREYQNMLCAEIWIPKKQIEDGVFDLLINGVPVEEDVSFYGLPNASNEKDGIDGALVGYEAQPGTALLYRYDGDINIDDTGLPVPADQEYARMIWVLDYVGGNMTASGFDSNVQHSIYEKYAGRFSPGENLRVGIQGSATATSFTEAHPYFFTESKSVYDRNQYTVTSARHLYNVRYVPNGNFRQQDDITLNGGVRPVSNFTPIPDFEGTYTAAYRANGTEPHAGYVIRNLRIDLPATTNNVGLFARIIGVQGSRSAEDVQAASVVGLTLENPSVTGGQYVGSVCGTLERGIVTGTYVRYTDAAKTISGAGDVGGIVGVNKGTLANSTFISPTAQTHMVATGAGRVGGLVGYNDGGAIKRALFLALAPVGPDGIHPIIGGGAIPGTDNQLYYLSGVAKHPSSPISYNTGAANTPDVFPLGTADLYEKIIGGDWQRELKDDGTPLLPEEVTALDNNGYPYYPYYPYPYSPLSQSRVGAGSQMVAERAWPVVDGFGDVKLSNVAYYEQYSDGTYGLWFIQDGQGNGSLQNGGKVITEAGYTIVLSDDLLAPHYFFASTNGIAWNTENRVQMSFDKDADFAQGIAAAARKHTQWQDTTEIPEIWSFKLPLDMLAGLEERSAPLYMMYTIHADGAEPQAINGYLQPLFAKGIYDQTNPTGFFIRTPWQMRNISVLTGANDTSGKRFTQEIDLDFKALKDMGGQNVGIGVLIGENEKETTMVYRDLTGPAVSGVFQGTYQGKAISNVVIQTSGGTASLFAENRGRIESIALKASTITNENGSASGIAGTNSGTIADCQAVSVAVSGSGGSAAGIANENSGAIANANVQSSPVDSTDGSAAGIANENSGTITSANVRSSDISGNNGSAAGIANENSGTITSANVRSSDISGDNGSAAGIAVVNTGLIDKANAESFTVTSQTDSTGGLAGGIAAINERIGGNVNTGKIENSKTVNVDVHGNSMTGGVAGENSGTIKKTSVSVSEITSRANAAGGIVGINSGGGSSSSGVVEGCTAEKVTVSGLTNVGGAAGYNQEFAKVSDTSVKNSTVSGDGSLGTGENIGGIAGANAGEVANCMVITVDVFKGKDNVGGVAGENSGSVLRTGVQYSTVKDSGGSIGGVVGDNADTGTASGVVEDVFFLSPQSPSTHGSRPISDPGKDLDSGGIAGNNNGTVMRALFIAPAPRSDTMFYPIVGNGTDGLDSFYLIGDRYSLNEGRSWPDSHTYYNRMLVWSSGHYSGGGEGLITSFIDKDWITFAHPRASVNWEGKSEWNHWLQPTRGYSYPILKNGMSVPEQWPETDSPVRPDQVERDDWEPVLPTSNRAQNLNFINGDFDAPLMNPNDSANTYDILRIPTITSAPASQSDVTNGGFNTSTNSSIPSSVSPTAKNGSNHYGMYIYYNSAWVQGWNTRPVDAKDQNNQYRNMMEFQRPYNSSLSNSRRYGRVRTNYNGGLTGAYVELNAEVPGTLFQIAPTIPGSELYYSFYHARRNAGNEVSGHQRMNFYLSGMVDDNGTWKYADGTGRPTIIRPCITPRGTGLSQADTRNTVVYGTTGTDAEETVTVSRVKFYDPKMNDGKGGEREAYLIDVWVGTPASEGDAPNTSLEGNGHGITFWYEGNAPQIGNSSSQIPLGGVEDITTAKSSRGEYYLPAYLLDAAKNNVIGYWDVKRFSNNTQYSEWKQYYGLYTIPSGQISTEFAFESASTRNMQEGNYLDGITFQSPGFLSIDKYVRIGDQDVKFVKPEDELTVDLAVKNWGEVAVNNIVVSDRFAPFTEYMDYVEGSAVVYRGNKKIEGQKIGGVTVQLPDAANKQTLQLTMPAGETLGTNEELLVSFKIKVKKEVTGGVPTLLYYFRNQGSVSYYDTGYRGYSSLNPAANPSNVKKNASGPEPVQVFIDPIQLTKTVKTVGGVSPDPLIDGPFEVELTIENSLDKPNSIVTQGMVTDIIPKGFVISNYGNLPDGSVMQPDDDGEWRITIVNADLTTTKTSLDYHYTLEYVGDRYGVSYTSTAADYKYVYTETDTEGKVSVMNVSLKFPQLVVGIRIQEAGTDRFHSGTATQTFDILEADFFAKKLTDDNYDVSPEVVLLRSDGTNAETNPNGDYQLNHDAYTATVVKSTSQLQFTPKSGANGLYEMYFRIDLNATKAGRTPFTLSSDPIKVSVFVTDADTLCYYEKYEDGTYGFYAGKDANGADIPVLRTLDNASPIIESGYGVISASTGKQVQLGTYEPATEPVNCNGAYLYTIAADAVADTGLLDVQFGVADNMAVLGQIHPNFAKEVYPAAAPYVDGGEEGAEKRFAIRTPQQMRNISPLAENSDKNETEGVVFVQERDLDFRTLVATAGTTAASAKAAVATAGTTAAASAETEVETAETTAAAPAGAAVATAGTTAVPASVPIATTPLVLSDSVVTGEFKGTFEVLPSDSEIPYTISYVKIKSTADNVGLFSKNSGHIKGIALRRDTRIQGRDYVGGIVGYNMGDGLIEDCTVLGYEDPENPGTYFGMEISGREHLGGIAGFHKEEDEIQNCSAENILFMSIEAAAFALDMEAPEAEDEELEEADEPPAMPEPEKPLDMMLPAKSAKSEEEGEDDEDDEDSEKSEKSEGSGGSAGVATAGTT